MHGNSQDITEKLKADCRELEEQVKVLVRTELQLRRTKAELIQTNKKIEEYNRTLEERVTARTRELVSINEKLSCEIAEREKAQREVRTIEEQLIRAERMEAVGLLAGSVAHDLNNLLSGIIGYPNIILRKLPVDSPLCKYIASIQQCGEKAAAVVRDMMTLSRRGMLSKESVNFNDMLNILLNSPEMERMKIGNPGVRIEYSCEQELFCCAGSSVHLYNALLNIVDNAFSAMPAGGRLSIAVGNVCLDRPRSGYEQIGAGEYVELVFTDTGAGIASRHLNRIFEPFYSRKIMGNCGTGLGMAIIWGTVKEHDGFIDVESSVGNGTTIRLYFPVVHRIARERAKLLSAEMIRGNEESVLIVDDLDIQRDLCTEMVRELGYVPVAVSSGEAAIDYLRNGPVDLLILDMIMDGGMNGAETYRKIIEMYPRQRAILVSGYSEPDMISEAQSLGAGTCLKKPYTLVQLGNAMKKELDSGSSATGSRAAGI